MAAAEVQSAAGWGRQLQQDGGGWRKGPWTSQEDALLVEHVRQHGEGRWNSVSKLTGLKRSGKSCRLRWVNYLRPDLKRGKITPQEESIIVQLHALWGNRWSTIARSLPGRTDNEIKNYWRTHFKKGKPSKNIERARARFLKQRREMQQSQQQQQPKLMPTPTPQSKDIIVAETGDARTDDDAGGAAAAVAPSSSSSSLSMAGREAEDLIMHQDAMDDLMMCPAMSYHLLLHGAAVAGHQLSDGGGSCCASTSEDYGSSEDDGATWGSLWNLDGAAGACTLW
ncbi:transcription repressor MYB6-like [Oryza glaberrima]|uniref:Uncharacterized protein n=1 Tax=Oryza glaberrima TaxID=4538 RepID=I1PMW6_ORYGL|nr:transcription repressor MYB6-like [Oryza glaberrima]XP_052151540.1 transcription repressor MYB6-like [Oryza glaberrima]